MNASLLNRPNVVAGGTMGGDVKASSLSFAFACTLIARVYVLQVTGKRKDPPSNTLEVLELQAEAAKVSLVFHDRLAR